MKNIPSVNDFKNELRRADPYEHAYIERKAFVEKYGEAAKRFIEEIRQKERLKWVKKIEGKRRVFYAVFRRYNKYPENIEPEEYIKNVTAAGYNQALADLIQLIQGEI